VAVGDLFNDGRQDVVIDQMDGVPALLRNVAKSDNHWIAFRLIGGPKSPRDAIGAKVFVTLEEFVSALMSSLWKLWIQLGSESSLRFRPSR